MVKINSSDNNLADNVPQHNRDGVNYSQYFRSKMKEDLIRERQLLEQQNKSETEINNIIKERKKLLSELLQKQEKTITAAKKENELHDLDLSSLAERSKEQSRYYSQLVNEYNVVADTTDEIERKNALLAEATNYQKLANAEHEKELKFKNQLATIEFQTATPKEKEALLRERAKRSAEIQKEGEIKYREALAKGATEEEATKLKSKYIADEGNKLGDMGVAGEVVSSLGKVAGKFPTVISILTNILRVVGKIGDFASSGIDQAIQLQAEYMGRLDARLYGILDSSGNQTTYRSVWQWMADSGSSLISQRKLLENISKLVDNGVGFNFEERALLQTISDRVATTFDALDTNLLRNTRLQQSDTSYAQLGTEAALTEFFNKTFSDSSYLSDAYDQTYGAIVDAMSQMTPEIAVEFNHAVQKWLGSLYSVGLSTQGVSTLAEGIGYLATGNVEALGSNTSLQNLFALSANNAGLNYADLLTQGIDASVVNTLMKSMVEYLQQIVQNTDNNVVRSAWTGITGLNISDLTRAMSNLTSADINNIYSNQSVYSDLVNTATKNVMLIGNRTPQAAMIENAIDNFLLQFGELFISEAYGSAGNVSLGSTIGMRGNNVSSRLGGGVSSSGTLSKAFAYILADKLGLDTIKDIIAGFDVVMELFTNKALRSQAASGMFAATNSNELAKLTSNLANYLMTGYSSIPTTSRGEAFTGFNTYNSIAAGISSSTAISTGGSGSAASAIASADTAIQSLAENAETLSATARNISDNSVGTVDKTITDLYSKLFEVRDVPIRVQMAEFEEKARAEMSETMAQRFKVDSGVPVDLVRSIIQGVDSVRGL